MSTRHQLTSNFSRLDKGLRLVGIGSALTILSIFMPWYEDLDAYNIGDRFFGISGPTMLIGLFILGMAAMVFWTFFAHLRGKKSPNLPVKEHIFNIFVGAQSFFLLVIVNSIFFHSKFGVNITLKESKFGMTLAFVGTLLVTLGGYLQMKEIQRHGDTGRLEPLINLDKKPEVAPVNERIVEEHRAVREKEPEQPSYRDEPVAVAAEAAHSAQTPSAQTPSAQTPSAQTPSAPTASAEEAAKGSYTIRMDL